MPVEEVRSREEYTAAFEKRLEAGLQEAGMVERSLTESDRVAVDRYKTGEFPSGHFYDGWRIAYEDDRGNVRVVRMKNNLAASFIQVENGFVPVQSTADQTAEIPPPGDAAGEVERMATRYYENRSPAECADIVVDALYPESQA